MWRIQTPHLAQLMNIVCNQIFDCNNRDANRAFVTFRENTAHVTTTGLGLLNAKSVKRINCDKTEEKSAQIFIPYERSFSLVFLEEEWLVGSEPLYLKFWVNRPCRSEIADFEQLIDRSPSAVIPSEKVP